MVKEGVETEGKRTHFFRVSARKFEDLARINPSPPDVIEALHNLARIWRECADAMREPLLDHDWTGWPGATCLRCGAGDNREICAAECPDFPGPREDGVEMPPCPNPEHHNGRCPR